jgi:two-component system response regulator YesN
VKLVIADDEYLIRASLISMISDIESSWDIVGEATNGEELVNLVRAHKPNIAIVDIRMPKLSGLEAIRLGKMESPLTKWVILSGFSDFTCAQEAMKLGASEYLLKPINPSELELALYNTYKDNKEIIILLNQQFENSLFTLCNGLTTLKNEERNSLFYQGWFAGATFIWDTAMSEKRLSELQSEFYDELRQCINNQLIYGMNVAMLALPNGELAVIGAWDSIKCSAGRQYIYSFFDDMMKILGRYCNDQIMVTTLQTGDCHGFEELNGKLEQLQLWGCLRAVCGLGQSLNYRELHKEASVPEKVLGSNLLCTIWNHSQDRIYLHYQKSVSELEALIQKTDLLSTETIRKSIIRFIRYTLGAAISEKATDEQWIQELKIYGENFLRMKKPKDHGSADLIKQVTRYIEEHYMDDIGIGLIASQLNVTANYLSTLFQKKTGVMFVKYLTNLRMLKAKELLLNTNLQVKQIAEKVGYFSTRHFTKLFTEAFGSYPSDYRKSQM